MYTPGAFCFSLARGDWSLSRDYCAYCSTYHSTVRACKNCRALCHLGFPINHRPLRLVGEATQIMTTTLLRADTFFLVISFERCLGRLKKARAVPALCIGAQGPSYHRFDRYMQKSMSRVQLPPLLPSGKKQPGASREQKLQTNRSHQNDSLLLALRTGPRANCNEWAFLSENFAASQYVLCLAPPKQSSLLLLAANDNVRAHLECPVRGRRLLLPGFSRKAYPDHVHVYLLYKTKRKGAIEV